MRSLSFSGVMASLCFLAACSNGGGGSNSPAYVMTKEFRPTEKPQNAAPADYLKEITRIMSDNTSFVPTHEAIFSAVIENNDVKYVWSGSPEKTAALGKLNSDGLKFLESVRQGCHIQDASKAEVGTPGQGSTTYTTLSMGTSGASCPLLINKYQKSATTYNKVDINQGNQSAHLEVSGTYDINQSQEIKDAEMIRKSGIQSMKMAMKVAMTSVIDQKGSSQSVKMKGDGTGNFSLALSTSEVISGPMTLEMVQVDGRQSLQVLFDGKCSRGAVRIVVRQESEEADFEIYLNGEKVDASKWPGIGNINDTIQ